MNASRKGRFPRFLFFWFPVIAYCVIIFIGSAMEKPLPETNVPQLDRFLHAVEFGGLCFLLIRALKKSFPEMPRRKMFIIAVSCTVLYGASDEIHQIFVPGRVSSIIDLFFDSLGALIIGLIKK